MCCVTLTRLKSNWEVWPFGPWWVCGLSFSGDLRSFSELCLLAGLYFGTFEFHSKPKSLLVILVTENNRRVCLSVCQVGGRCKTFKSPCHCGNLGMRRLRVRANAFENVLCLCF